jgi:hypothetical protein
MPVIYPKLYVKCQDEQDWSIFTDVTALISGASWWEYEGTYRDLPKVTFGSTSTTGSTPTSAPSLASLAIAGDNTVVPATVAEIPAKQRFVAPDDALHVAPRYKLVQHTGYMLTTHADGLPAMPTPPYQSENFTVASAGVFTLAGVHNFVTGELVAVSSAGTLPAGLDAVKVYSVVAMYAGTIRLRDITTGSMVVTSTSGSGIHAITKITDLDFQSSQVFRFSDVRRPQFSLSAPE